MGCFPLANYHLQMGVTVVEFAEHFGHYHMCAARIRNHAKTNFLFDSYVII